MLDYRFMSRKTRKEGKLVKIREDWGLDFDRDVSSPFSYLL